MRLPIRHNWFTWKLVMGGRVRTFWETVSTVALCDCWIGDTWRDWTGGQWLHGVWYADA